MEPRIIPFPGAPSGAAPHWTENPRLHQAVLLAGAVLLLFTRLWETSLASYDDTYYAEKAKEILLTGRWLVPPWDSQPRFDNTPLGLWVMAVLFRLFGVSEFAARVPAALAGVGCILLTYRFGRRLFGEWVGFLSGLALLTTPYFLKYSRHAMLDVTQTLLVSGSLLLLVRGTERRRTMAADLAAGALAALAVLNKSLLGYFPFLIYAVWAVVARVPWRRALRPGVVASLAAALALPGVWFGAVAVRHGEVFLREHFGRILWHRAVAGDPGQELSWASHLDYFSGLFRNFLPWIPMALIGAWALSRGAEGRRRGALPLAWAGTVLGVMTLSLAKKSWYVMPAYPALALLAGVGIDLVLRRRPGARQAFAAGMTGLVAAAHLAMACLPIPVGQDRNRDVKALGPAIRAAVPEGRHLLSFGLEPHWRYVSPVYFYADRPLALPEHDLRVMVRILEGAEAEAALAGLETLERLIPRMSRPPRVLAASGPLVLIGPPPPAPAGGPPSPAPV